MSRTRATNALKALVAGLEPKREKSRGLLGIPGQTSPNVTGRDNYVWFQEDGNPSKLRQIINYKVPNISDLPVVVGQDSNNPGQEQVLDVDIGMLPGWLGRSFVPEHHSTHELGAVDSSGNRVDGDVVYIQKAQFTPLSARAQDTPDMSLYIEEDWYRYGTQRNYWPGGSTKTFSPPVTDGWAAYELVCIDGAVNQLVYVRGVDFPINAPQDYTLIPDEPVGSLPVVAVFLPYGETTLNYDNMADARIFQNTSGGSVEGLAHQHTSEIDGGLLASGLTITGDVILKRASDQRIGGNWLSELEELHISNGGISVTGDIIITGGTVQLRDSLLGFYGDAVINTDIPYEGNLSSIKGDIAYNTYGLHPLTTPLTSAAWDGDSYSTTAKTLINLPTIFGVPDGIKAIDAHIIINDSGSPAANLFLILSPNNVADQGLGPRCDAAPADAKVNASVLVPCNEDGNVYYQVAASEAATMDAWIAIWGYWI